MELLDNIVWALLHVAVIAGLLCVIGGMAILAAFGIRAAIEEWNRGADDGE